MITLQRARDRTPVPWKNGGGTTTEVAAFPQGAGFDNFDWRISIATVRQGGPFSKFPDVDRKLAVLKGQMRLSIGDTRAVILSPTAAPEDFPADVPCEAQILEGPVTDLNVMTRRGVFISRIARHHEAYSQSVRTPGGGITIIIATQRCTLTCGANTHDLDAQDALLVQDELDRTISISASAADSYWIEIFPS